MLAASDQVHEEEERIQDDSRHRSDRAMRRRWKKADRNSKVFVQDRRSEEISLRPLKVDFSVIEKELGKMRDAPPEGAFTINDIVEKYGVSRSTVKSILDRMQRDGDLRSGMYLVRGRWIRYFWEEKRKDEG